MAKRGESFRKEAKIRIFEYLIGRSASSTSELAEALGVSRVTALSLLDSLVESGDITKQGERVYSLRTDVRMVLLKIGNESAEIITTDLCGESLQRTPVRLISSMSYEDNCARLMSMTERYADELVAQGYEPYCALICYGELSRRGIPGRFLLLSGRDVLAHGLCRLYGDEAAVAYIDGDDASSYLCFGNQVVSSGKCTGEIADDLSAAMRIFPVQRVLLAGAPTGARRSIGSALFNARVEFSFIDASELRPDERTAMLRIMADRI